MAFDFKFPDVGEGIHEGKIVKWLVKVGDDLKQDETIAEVETDKAVVEIPTPKAGKITQLYHKEGDVIKVGETMISLEEPARAQKTAAPAAAATTQTPPAAMAASLQPAPAPTEEPKRDSTAVVGSLEIDTGGIMKAPAFDQAGAVFGGAVFTQPSIPAAQSAQPAPTPAVQTPAPAATLAPPPAPVAQTLQPAQSAAPTSVSQPSQEISSGVGAVKPGLKSVKKYDLFGYVDRVKYESIRKAVGDHMVKSMFTIPHVTHTDIADVDKLFKIREKEKIKAEKKGIKLTFMPFIIKATVAALKKHPYLNATLDEQNGEIILKKYLNIGVAVDTEAGLMVPVIKGADKKDMLEIAQEIVDLAEKARSRKLNPMDMKGGTFTITNIGSAGGGWFATPVINYPEAAILGTGMIQDMPVARNGKVVIRKMLPISLAFDHRILDGAEAARFVNDLKQYLEDPDQLLVEEK
jgi:pyruvate dehydrogenase E2 component (dihydrolipoamide acetyltransferase)